MRHYFSQIAPDALPEQAAKQLWRSVDVFGKEGSLEKELGIKKAILGEDNCRININP
jgi:hypothetical protein